MLHYDDLLGILAHEGFFEVAHGSFAYHQTGADPWFMRCTPDPDGYVDIGHVLWNLQLPTP